MRRSAPCRWAHFAFYRRFFKEIFAFVRRLKSRLYYPAKRGGTTAFRQKGGDYMEPNRREFQKQCVFQSFCKRVLHNEACNAHDEIRRRRKREVSFVTLPCMRNGSFTLRINIFKLKQPSRLIKWQEKK